MPAPIRLGTCSWADEGLVKHWYPRGTSTAAARLRYYAERFDTVEVDSTFYALPHPETAQRWADRTPPEFTFNVKASGEMTGHRQGPARETAFALFRAALEPLEVSGKWLGVLLQYPPWFTKTEEARQELLAAAALVQRGMDGLRLILGCDDGRVGHGARPRPPPSDSCRGAASILKSCC